MPVGSEERVIHIIGPSRGTIGDLLPLTFLSNRHRKAKMQALDNVVLSCFPVSTILSDFKLLTISKEDKDRVVFPNWDLLVIAAKIMGVTIYKIMINNSSFCNILFKKRLDQLGDFHSYVEPCEI